MSDLDQPGTHRFASRGQFRRDQAIVPESSLATGRFGRMFRNLPAYRPEDDFLDKLADTMVEQGRGENAERLVAGLTYLGQFIDHDLTFDPVSSLARQNDPDALVNFRTPVFDLDCVYGRGRDDQPYMYDGDKFLLGTAAGSDEPDLPRNDADPRRALIGDPRNDENIIIAQLQLAFLRLHNRLVDDVQDGGALAEHRWSDETAFEAAQRLARWHYQWLVVTYFLPAICDPDVWSDYFEEKRDRRTDVTCRRILELRYYKPRHRAYIPVEWSVAAYRFGHSLIRQKYHLNDALRQARGGSPLDIFLDPPNPRDDLGGRRQLPSLWSIDWRMFFKFEGETEDLQMARKIDTDLAGGLQAIPGVSDGPRQLARRNLHRGKAMGLPAGEVLARRLCRTPLSRSQLELEQDAPLWYYILREAEVHGERGEHLGPVGSTLVAEAMLGMLDADPFSFLNTDPTWEPAIPQTTRGDWDIADLLSYAVPDDGRRLEPPSGPPPPTGSGANS